MSDRFPVYHSKGAKACGKIAFYTERPWKTGDTYALHRLTLLSGLQYLPTSTAVCGACHVRIGPYAVSLNPEGTN